MKAKLGTTAGMCLILAGGPAASAPKGSSTQVRVAQASNDRGSGAIATGPAAQLAIQLGLDPHFLIGMGNDLAGAAQGYDHDRDGIYTLDSPLDLHYCYLVGLMGQGGWPDWNPGGSFVNIMTDSAARHGVVPMFTFYTMASWGEGDLGVLTNDDFMRRFWNGAALLFDRLSLFNQPAVVGTRQIKPAPISANTWTGLARFTGESGNPCFGGRCPSARPLSRQPGPVSFQSRRRVRYSGGPGSSVWHRGGKSDIHHDRRRSIRASSEQLLRRAHATPLAFQPFVIRARNNRLDFAPSGELSPRRGSSKQGCFIFGGCQCYVIAGWFLVCWAF